MEFTLKITLGNDAMQTVEDLAFLVSRAAESLAIYYEGEQETLQPSYLPQPLNDRNGNRVGEWEVTESPSLQDLDPVDGKRFYRVSRGYDAVVSVPEDADKWAIREAANDATGENFVVLAEISRDEYLADSGEDDDTDDEDEEDEEDEED